MTNQSENKQSRHELNKRLAWFKEYTEQLDKQSAALPLRCPCCGYKTLHERGAFDICQVCYWEDDGQDNHDCSIVRGGPNGSLSLTEARENYIRYGASDARFLDRVRQPRRDELLAE